MTSERQRLHRAVFKTRGSQRGYAGEEAEKPKGIVQIVSDSGIPVNANECSPAKVHNS